MNAQYPPPDAYPEAYSGQRPAYDDRRPGGVTTSAVIFLVFGSLTILLSIFFFVGSAFIGELDSEQLGIPMSGLEGAIANVLIVFAVVILTFGVLQVVTGINLFGPREWARILGIVLAVLGSLFTILSLVSTLTPQPADPDFGGEFGTAAAGDASPVGIAVNLLVLLAYVYVTYALFRAGRWFSRRA